MSTRQRHHRHSLDELVVRLRDPGFTCHHRRRLSLRQASVHVNPVMLAVSARDSVYVTEWRDHAHRCAQCGRLFAYFGLA